MISLLVVGGAMIAAAAFFLQINTGSNGVDAFPEGSYTKDAFFILEKEFSFGVAKHADIVVEGDISSPEVQGAIEKVASSIQDDPRFPLPAELKAYPDANLAVLSVAIAGEPTDPSVIEAVTAIREQYVASAFSGVDAEAQVGGLSAEHTDFRAISSDYTPVVFAFVLGLSFILLMLVFRSVVIPLKAILMNLLSVGATYGILVIVFQKGLGADLFGLHQTEVIDL